MFGWKNSAVAIGTKAGEIRANWIMLTAWPTAVWLIVRPPGAKLIE